LVRGENARRSRPRTHTVSNGQARNLFFPFPGVSEIHPAAITGPYRPDFIPNTPGSGSGRLLPHLPVIMALLHPTTTLQPPVMTLRTAVRRAPSVAWRQLPRPTVSVLGPAKARAASAALLLPGRRQSRRLATGPGSATGYTANEGKVGESSSRLRFSSVRNSLSRPFPGWCSPISGHSYSQLMCGLSSSLQPQLLSSQVAWRGLPRDRLSG
jgi:hypothetical protein